MAAQQKGSSFDHLVGGKQQLLWDSETQRLGGREVDDEIELCRLLDWDVAGPRTAQNFIDVVGSASEQSRDVCPVRQQSPCSDDVAGSEARWQLQVECQRSDVLTVDAKQSVF